MRPTISGEILSVLPGSRKASPLNFNMALLKKRPVSPIPDYNVEGLKQHSLDLQR